MSNKEQIIQLINNIPDYKLTYVVDMLNSIKDLLVEEVAPDEWDLQMIEDAKKNNDGATVTFEELLAKEKELTLDDIFKDYDGESAVEKFDWGSPVGKEV
ncbi:MAG: hypothetical protein NC231_07425 [Bacillus sp. (in: Bacteria)]|nr:hypothetical protein [Bacillus sp. (in: firmicutes)]MCM1427418.1 hypothetical protein [Eubacterium sp.]